MAVRIHEVPERQYLSLGPAVRAVRHERGMTLKQLGVLAGLSYCFLSQIERDLAKPSLDSLERIAEALGVRLCQLLLVEEVE